MSEPKLYRVAVTDLIEARSRVEAVRKFYKLYLGSLDEAVAVLVFENIDDVLPSRRLYVTDGKEVQILK
ncbi:MAG: hypothetical protein PHO89_11720 [Methylacidiphilaceae bacterium]|nr:hypothetical protein [Candidatus Methylacidiphilaceae bacterium]